MLCPLGSPHHSLGFSAHHSWTLRRSNSFRAHLLWLVSFWSVVRVFYLSGSLECQNLPKWPPGIKRTAQEGYRFTIGALAGPRCLPKYQDLPQFLSVPQVSRNANILFYSRQMPYLEYGTLSCGSSPPLPPPTPKQDYRTFW